MAGVGREDACWHEEAVEKKQNPLVSCVSLHFRKWAGNRSKWVKLKTGSTVIQRNKHTLSRWVKRWNSFFFFSQKRINFDKTSSALTNMSWYLLHTIFSERKSLSIAAFNLFDSSSFSFHLIGFFKATNNCTRRFTRNNICFKTFSADANTSWYLPHSISSKWQFVSVATVNQIQDVYSINNPLKPANDNYAWRFPVIISFMRINTWNSRLFQRPVGNTASNPLPETSIEMASFCCDFNALNILNTERHFKCKC